MPATVNDLLRYIAKSQSGESALIYDIELNSMLDPFRQTYPMAYRCPKTRCRTTVAYWALSSEGARVVPGPKRREWKGRIAGTRHIEPDAVHPRGPASQKDTFIVGGAADLQFPGLEFQHRFEEAIEWAMRGDGMIRLEGNPEVGSGWPLRWRFICPTCRTPRVYTNKAMLQLFLRALNMGLDEIRPGRIY